MKPKYQRLRFIAGSLLVMGIAVAIMLRSFNDNLVFFFTPTQLVQKKNDSSFDPARELRIGGLVEVGSVKNRPGGGIDFVITDFTTTLPVTYSGLVPSLFREGQGVVAQGTLQDGLLNARTILAKHDENYMPKEVVDQLRASGLWDKYGVKMKSPEGGLTPPSRHKPLTPAARGLASPAHPNSSAEKP